MIAVIVVVLICMIWTAWIYTEKCDKKSRLLAAWYTGNDAALAAWFRRYYRMNDVDELMLLMRKVKGERDLASALAAAEILEQNGKLHFYTSRVALRQLFIEFIDGGDAYPLLCGIAKVNWTPASHFIDAVSR